MMQSQGRLVFSLSKKEFIICSLGSQWFLLFRINEWILCMILVHAVFDLCPPTQSSMHGTALQYTNYSSLWGIMKERKNRRKKHEKWVKKKSKNKCWWKVKILRNKANKDKERKALVQRLKRKRRKRWEKDWKWGKCMKVDEVKIKIKWSGRLKKK